MRNIKEILTYQIKKSFIPLIIFTILGIFIYGSDEFNFVKLKEEIIPLAYSQTHKCPSGENPRPSPTAIFLSPSLFPFKISDQTIVKQLLNIEIEMDPIINNNEHICYNFGNSRYEVRKTDGSMDLTQNKLKLEIKSGKLKADFVRPDLNYVDLINNPIINDIDTDLNGILNSLEGLCQIQPTNKIIDCDRGSTKLTIDGKNEKIIVGASGTNPNGIIIISEQKRTQDAVVEACEKEKFRYEIPPNSVIEIDCK